MTRPIAITVLLLFCLIALAGCSQTRDTSSTAAGDNPPASSTANPGTSTPSSNTATGGTASAPSAPADNTGVNVRDRNDANPTAEDQSGSPADVELTRKIRKAITDDDALSVDAHNVKIITRNGVVTLRGPVHSDLERAAVVKKAEQFAGAGKVVNQLEIAG